MNSAASIILKAVFLALVTVVVTFVAGEGMLRIKNSDQKNYTIEMWRYARELKRVSENPALGHVHIENSAANLQNTRIEINSMGMRGPEPKFDDASKKTVLLLGSSITLGWGVEEKKTIRAKLETHLGEKYQVLNGGIGNYNTARSVFYFGKNLRYKIKPDTVIIHYFLNDAEYLPPSEENIFLRNSQMAVTLYYIVNGFLRGSQDVASLVEHYEEVYRPENRGFRDMVTALDAIKTMSEESGFQVIVALIPDIHQLEGYAFQFIHEKVRALAEEREFDFVDFLGALDGYKGPELWTIPGDPHPNSLVHEIMAEHLAPLVR